MRGLDDSLEVATTGPSSSPEPVHGVRSLLLALPPLLVGGSLATSGWTYLPGFAFGILVGMGAVGLVFAEGLERVGTAVADRLQRMVAIGSAALGVFWIATRL